MPPEVAGETIVRGVENRKVRVVVGADAKRAAPAPADPHTIALTLGINCFGQLGVGDEHNERKKPTVVAGALEGKPVATAIAGGMHTLVLTRDGDVWAESRWI